MQDLRLNAAILDRERTDPNRESMRPDFNEICQISPERLDQFNQKKQ